MERKEEFIDKLSDLRDALDECALQAYSLSLIAEEKKLRKIRRQIYDLMDEIEEMM